MFGLLVLFAVVAYGDAGCSMRHTGSNLDGGGNIVYLDRQHPTCGNGVAMSSFHLRRPNGNHILYDYRCCHMAAVCKTHKKASRFDLDGGGKSWYLDRQPVDCGANGLIEGFVIRRSHPVGKIHYEYTCCTNAHNLKCYWGTTGFTDDGRGNLVYLDRQTVTCKAGYGLSYFRMQRNGHGNRLRYHYRCCQLPAHAPSHHASHSHSSGSSGGHWEETVTYEKVYY